MDATNRRIELTIDNIADFLLFESPFEYAESVVRGLTRGDLIDESDPLVSKFLARLKVWAERTLDKEDVEYVLTPFEASVILNTCNEFDVD